MITSLLIRWVVLTVAVELTAWILPGVALEGGAITHLMVALLIGLANALVPVLTGRLPQPRSGVLLAVLTLAINAVLIWVVAALTPWLTVTGLIAAAAATVLITVFATVLSLILDRVMATRADRRGRPAQPAH